MECVRCEVADDHHDKNVFDGCLEYFANQTVSAPGLAARNAVNQFIRAGALVLKGYFEVTDQLEAFHESGKWAQLVTPATPGASANHFSAITGDGTHPIQQSYFLVVRSAAINARSVWDTRRKESNRQSAGDLYIPPTIRRALL